nr:hypothetical protein [Ilyobacter polytropus]
MRQEKIIKKLAAYVVLGINKERRTFQDFILIKIKAVSIG